MCGSLCLCGGVGLSLGVFGVGFGLVVVSVFFCFCVVFGWWFVFGWFGCGGCVWLCGFGFFVS